MFTLTPLAVALQGIGYGTLLTAMQGLLAVTVAPPLVIDEPQGSMGRIAPRRRVRRTGIATALLPHDAFAAPAQDEEELLLALGVL